MADPVVLSVGTAVVACAGFLIKFGVSIGNLRAELKGIHEHLGRHEDTFRKTDQRIENHDGEDADFAEKIQSCLGKLREEVAVLRDRSTKQRDDDPWNVPTRRGTGRGPHEPER